MQERQFAYPIVLSIRKIWDQGSSHAMTDVIRFHNQWFCTFCESNGQVDNIIRVIHSSDAENWKPAHFFSKPEQHLSHPTLSITPQGRLMLLFTGVSIQTNNLQTYVTYYDGIAWTKVLPISIENECLWRVTWFQGIAYGVSYHLNNNQVESTLKLYRSLNGSQYEEITQLNVPNVPKETTLRFYQTGEMLALVKRSEKQSDNAWFGRSYPPYLEWAWSDSKRPLHSPNFLLENDRYIWAAGKTELISPYYIRGYTILALAQNEKINPLFSFPSWGEVGGTGMDLEGHILWMSYISSHEGKPMIYLSRVDLLHGA